MKQKNKRLSSQSNNFKSLTRPPSILDQSSILEHVGQDTQKRQIFKLRDKEKRIRIWNKICGIKRLKWLSLERKILSIEKYLHWSFATSFPDLFFKLVFVYSFLILALAVLIWFFCDHEIYNHCINPTFDGASNLKRFNYSFHLSWTTFSTVGYGIAYPTTRGAGIWDTLPNADSSYEYADGCLPVSIVCSLGSFLGILYASLSGAIIVAKVSRIHSVAHVIFSTPILLRYQKERNPKNKNAEQNLPTIDQDGKVEEDFACHPKLETVTCPILEFQILNRLGHRSGGELIHSNVVCVAKVIAQQRPTKIYKKNTFMRLIKMGKSETKQAFKSSNDKRKKLTSTMTEKHDYIRIHFLPDFHPVFKQVWRLHHVLDHDSPLLTHSVREVIKNNLGRWPKELITSENFSKSIIFEKIIINFTGTSPRNASELTLQKSYYRDDILEGCRFAGACSKKDDVISVNISMINDVIPQRDGTWKDIKPLS